MAAWRAACRQILIASLMMVTVVGGQAANSGVFDFAQVRAAISYLEDPTMERLEAVARTDAMQHLKRHSDRTGYYPAESSTLDIAKELIGDPPNRALVGPVKELLERVERDAAGQQVCLSEPLRYGPPGAEIRGHVYFTWGYDIGVAEGVDASLNLAHPRFLEQPSEVWYCCIHELHHTLVMDRYPLPRLAEIRDGRQFLALVRYLTYLEGTAVYAALDARRRGGALGDDPDYVALGDPAVMRNLERRYLELYDQIESFGDRPLTDTDWKLLESFAGGDRLWYRVGAEMAESIDAVEGREAFREVVAEGPEAFFEHARRAGALHGGGGAEP